MIHVKLNGRNVQSYEIGTRKEFDINHGGDSAWMFVDNDLAIKMIDVGDFYTDPQSYFLNKYNFLQKKFVAKATGDGILLVDPDGAILTDEDQSLLTESA